MNCIYQLTHDNPEYIFCTLDLKFSPTSDCDKCKDRIGQKVVVNKGECIHKYEKSIGDEGFSFCDLEDRCVEGDVCKYCMGYEEEEDNG